MIDFRRFLILSLALFSALFSLFLFGKFIFTSMGDVDDLNVRGSSITFLHELETVLSEIQGNLLSVASSVIINSPLFCRLSFSLNVRG